MKNRTLKAFAEILLPGPAIALIFFLSHGDSNAVRVSVAAILIFAPIFSMAAKGAKVDFPDPGIRDRSIKTIVQSNFVSGLFVGAAFSFYSFLVNGVSASATGMLFNYVLVSVPYMLISGTIQFYLRRDEK